MGTIVNSNSENVTIRIPEEQVIEIASSRKDIEESLFIDNSTLKKEVKTWLKER